MLSNTQDNLVRLLRRNIESIIVTSAEHLGRQSWAAASWSCSSSSCPGCPSSCQPRSRIHHRVSRTAHVWKRPQCQLQQFLMPGHLVLLELEAGSDHRELHLLGTVVKTAGRILVLWITCKAGSKAEPVKAWKFELNWCALSWFLGKLAERFLNTFSFVCCAMPPSCF